MSFISSIVSNIDKSFQSQNQWKPNPSDLRADGSQKGTGFLGQMARADGKTATEISVGVNIGGKNMDIPSMVPGLTKQEISYLLESPLDTNMWKNSMGQTIMQKAVNHAKMRMSEGKSVFKEAGE